MKLKHDYLSVSFILILLSLLLVACGSHSTDNVTATTATKPEWFDIKLTDVRTSTTFTINDFAGKVVSLETIAMWCPIGGLLLIGIAIYDVHLNWDMLKLFYT